MLVRSGAIIKGHCALLYNIGNSTKVVVVIVIIIIIIIIIIKR